MNKQFIHLCLFLLSNLSVLSVISTIWAQQPNTQKTEISIDSQQFLSLRNGQDFQKTKQLDSQFYGFFSPKIKTEIKTLTFLYDGEVGYDLWQASHLGNEVINRNHGIMIRNREIAIGFKQNQLSSKFGLQGFDDGTGLFLKHYGLGATLQFQHQDFQLQLFWAGLSSNPFEGMQLETNAKQFTNDQHILGLKARVEANGFKSHLSAIAYRDSALLIDLFNAHFDAQYETQSENFVVYASIDLQWQKRLKQEWSLADQISRQWALQIGSRLKINQKLHVGINAFAISGDGQNGFFYSGKNQSSTLMLTQDENRDRYDNLDERLARTQGSFFMNQSGFEVADLKLSYFWMDTLKTSLIVGVAKLQKEIILPMVMTRGEASNAVGSELSLVNRLKISDDTSVLIVLQGMMPGSAGRLINESDFSKSGWIFGGMMGVVSRF